jgi:integrase
MATFTFILKEADAQRETPIFLIIRENGKRLKFSTGEKIHPAKWDASTYRVQGAKLTPTEKAVNTQLARYEAAFELLNSAAKLAGQPVDLNHAKNYLNKEFTTRPQAEPLTFVGFANGHRFNVNRKERTLKGYFTTIKTIQAFENEKRKGKALKFEDITLDFYAAFVDYLKDKGYANNTIGSYIKNVKVFMDAAFEKGLHTNTDFRKKDFKKLKEEVNHIYLTETELNTLHALELPLNGKLDKVRDLFLVACRTGLRFSDLRNLTPDKLINTEAGRLIQIQTKKTGQTVYIPLHAQTVDILTKHNYNLPPVPSNQKFNAYVKELAKLADITETVTITRTQGGQRTETILPKFKLVTVHTARRTFATLAYKAGLPAHSIMKITGHRSEKSFQAYIKLDAREHALLMAKHDFFKPQLKIVG